MEQTFNYIVEFNNGHSVRVIGETKDYKECSEIISKFLEDRNYKSRYWRHWVTEDKKKIQVDVGSWSQFFYISRSDNEDMTMML
jgi:hypothetical protein